MLYYIFKRFIYSLFTLWVIITIIFFTMHSIPGNIYSTKKALPPAIENNIKAKYGLDKPLAQQYLIVLKGIIRFDFGMSIENDGRSVNEMITEHFPYSLKVGLLALFFCVFIGIPLGVFSALHSGKWQDYLLTILATIGVAVPSFILAALLQYFFAVKLRLFHVLGLRSIWDAVLPALALALLPMSFIAKLTSSSMMEVLAQNYIKAAKARGLSRRTVIVKHALKNSILPVVTYMGPLTAGLLTGSFAIETIFGIPGLGGYYVDSILSRDYTTIMGVSVFYAIFLIVMNFLVDIVYVLIDPRIRLKS
ncbi:MAG: ABC transporter permease [Clostridia bacterium]|nr:ABC transporter permease [Clostridia bacterium]